MRTFSTCLQVRQLGFLVQAGRVTEDDVERVLAPVRRVLPSTGVDTTHHADHAAVASERKAQAAADADASYAASVTGASVREDVGAACDGVDRSGIAGTGDEPGFKRRSSEPSVEQRRMSKLARLDDNDGIIFNNKNNHTSETDDGDDIEDGTHAGNSLGQHQTRACRCVRLPCSHSDVFRIDVGPFAQCTPLDDGLRRDLQRDTIPTLQLAGDDELILTHIPTRNATNSVNHFDFLLEKKQKSTLSHFFIHVHPTPNTRRPFHRCPAPWSGNGLAE